MLNIAQMGVLGFASRVHPRLEAWLARGTALGYTLPSAAQQVKLNTFFYALESAGIITGVTSSLLDVLYIFAIDGSSDMATLNIITPTLYQASKVNSPTFTSNQGFTGNGSTSYLNTGWSPGTNGVNYTQNSAGLGGYVNTNVGSATQVDMGAANTNFATLNSRGGVNTILAAVNQATAISPAPANASSIGFYHVKRTGSNANEIWKNGTSLVSTTGASGARPTANVFVCAYSSAGTPTQLSTRQIGMTWWGAPLTGLESSFYTAWNNYFTSL